MNEEKMGKGVYIDEVNEIVEAMEAGAFEKDDRSRTLLIGLGGAGCNYVFASQGNMPVENCALLAIHTNSKALQSYAPVEMDTFLIGKGLLKGLGADMQPEKGNQAMEESKKALRNFLEKKYHVDHATKVLVCAGLGGGTGSGAIAPLIRLLKEDLKAEVAVCVWMPFNFEGSLRRKNAEEALERIRNEGITEENLLVQENQEIYQLMDDSTTFPEAMRCLDRAADNHAVHFFNP